MLKSIPGRPDARSVEMLVAFSCSQGQAEFERYLPVTEDDYNNMAEKHAAAKWFAKHAVDCFIYAEFTL